MKIIKLSQDPATEDEIKAGVVDLLSKDSQELNKLVCNRLGFMLQAKSTKDLPAECHARILQANAIAFFVKRQLDGIEGVLFDQCPEYLKWELIEAIRREGLVAIFRNIESRTAEESLPDSSIQRKMVSKSYYYGFF